MQRKRVSLCIVLPCIGALAACGKGSELGDQPKPHRVTVGKQLASAYPANADAWVVIEHDDASDNACKLAKGQGLIEHDTNKPLQPTWGDWYNSTELLTSDKYYCTFSNVTVKRNTSAFPSWTKGQEVTLAVTHLHGTGNKIGVPQPLLYTRNIEQDGQSELVFPLVIVLSGKDYAAWQQLVHEQSPVHFGFWPAIKGGPIDKREGLTKGVKCMIQSTEVKC